MARIFATFVKPSKINVTMKQILLFIAMLVLAVAPMRAEEDDHYWVDDILYTINDDSTTVTVISCTDGMESLTIPSTVDINGVNYRVTDIGAWAFEGIHGGALWRWCGTHRSRSL